MCILGSSWAIKSQKNALTDDTVRAWLNILLFNLLNFHKVMFKLTTKQILLLFFTIIYVVSIEAQTANGGCSTVTVTNTGGGYPANTYFANVSYSQFKNVECTVKILKGDPVTPRFSLFKKQPNGTFLGVGFTQYDFVFTGLSTGIYKVQIEVPQVDLTTFTKCPSGLTCINGLGQVIGLWGKWDPNKKFTNEVNVGAVTQNDIGWVFNNDTFNNNLFYPNDAITMNTTNTKNYDSWWLAVFENGGQNRYWSNGWTNGPIPNDKIDLKQLWNSGTGSSGFAQFPINYTIQFAITASCNTSWVNLDKQLSICNSRSVGCRVASDENILISPNPSNGNIKIEGIESENNQYKVILADVSGKIVKEFSEFSGQMLDVSDLDNGLYFVSIWNGTKKVKTVKLSILK